MDVKLLHHTPLWVAGGAIRTCWMSQEKSDTLFTRRGTPYKILPEETYNGEVLQSDKGVKCEAGDNDKILIERVANKFKHKSTLEHLDYNFYISGISRAVLQELARHRTASLSVKSSRYTLKELKYNCSFYNSNQAEGVTWRWDEVEKYCVLTGNIEIDEAIASALSNLKELIEDGLSNDVVKYCMPEAYKTELTWTCDARNLQNFLSLRTDKAALWEIRNLANAIFEALPEEHKYLFVDSVKVYD